MTKAYVYVDQNVISHFCLERDASLWEACRELGLTPIVSDLHLTEICLSPNPFSFAAPAERLGAFYLSSEKELELAQLGTADLVAFDAATAIDWHANNTANIERYFLQSLFPLLKISGGLAGIGKREIEDEFIASMRNSIEPLFDNFGPISRFCLSGFFKIRLWFTERRVKHSFEKINFKEDTAKLVAIRERISSVGNMSQISSDALVERVFGLFDDADRQQIQKVFPRGFGIDSRNRSSNIMALAFLLFTVGAVPKSGKVYRGDADTQKKKYRAQFIDCMHIGKASYFAAFMTNDSGAHRLAQAVFAYAGVATESINIERAKLSH